MSQKRILERLLDQYCEQVWFGVSHKHTFLRPTYVPKSTFKMKPLKFQIYEVTFHEEVYSWPGVAMEIRNRVYI